MSTALASDLHLGFGKGACWGCVFDVSFGLPKGQWCKSNLDGMPIPAPDAATTPTPRMITEDAWRYNEDADMKLLCLRLFALQQRARLMPGDLASRRVRLGELLP